MPVNKKSKYRKTGRLVLRTLLVLFILINLISIFHAYKFTHFYDNRSDYRKKPEELNFWDKTKAIFFGVNLTKSKIDAYPDHPYDIIHLMTSGKLKISGWYISNDSAKGTMIMFHGHGSNKSKILLEADWFYKLGYNIFLIDFRAHGDSEGNTCTIGMRESEEVKLSYDFVRNKGEANIVMWGVTMGAAAISHAIAQYDLHPSKIILEMPYGSLFDAVKVRVHMMGLPEEPVSALLTFWGGTIRGFWAFDLAP